MRHFWQWLCGYVCVCLNGRQLNRFLNLCSRNGIHLWHISYDMEHFIRVKLRLKDFYHLKPYLKKTKTHLKLLNRRGFPFWCHRHPKLKWFFVAVLCCICMAIYSFNFVWNINITGNSNVSSQDILDYLAKQKIEVGIKSNTIDCAAVEQMIRQEFQQIGWVSVYVRNTNLYVEIKESLYEEYEWVNDKNIQYDLVSNKDAIIYSIVTRSGTSIIKEGDYVQKGDILVVGQCEIFDDAGEVKDVLKLRADAKIIGDVTYEIFGNFTEMEILSLKISGLYSDKMLMALANQKILHFMKILDENGVIILDKNVIIDKNNKNISFSGTIKAREEIGINVLMEETIDNEFE